jgi:hypothetical protein
LSLQNASLPDTHVRWEATRLIWVTFWSGVPLTCRTDISLTPPSKTGHPDQGDETTSSNPVSEVRIRSTLVYSFWGSATPRASPPPRPSIFSYYSFRVHHPVNRDGLNFLDHTMASEYIYISYFLMCWILSSYYPLFYINN